MAIVDTSFWIAFQLERDQFHEKGLAADLTGDRFLVPREGWVEFVDVMLRLLPAKRVAAPIASTLEGPFDVQTVLDPADHQGLGLQAHTIQTRFAREGRRPLSTYDLVVCAVAQRYRKPL